MTLKNFVTSQHKATKRDYLGRMTDDKVNCMLISKKYGKDYWDGRRRYGYGGYKYIPGLWTNVAKKIIKEYGLTNSSKIIDLGCDIFHITFYSQVTFIIKKAVIMATFSAIINAKNISTIF